MTSLTQLYCSLILDTIIVWFSMELDQYVGLLPVGHEGEQEASLSGALPTWTGSHQCKGAAVGLFSLFFPWFCFSLWFSHVNPTCVRSLILLFPIQSLWSKLRVGMKTDHQISSFVLNLSSSHNSSWNGSIALLQAEHWNRAFITWSIINCTTCYSLSVASGAPSSPELLLWKPLNKKKCCSALNLTPKRSTFQLVGQ